MFILYINDLATVAPRAFALLFADDTSLFYSGKDIDEITQTINEELRFISEWLQTNKLSLNVGKTNYIIFTRGNSRINDANLMIKNTSVQRVFSTKFLGVYIDSQLCWKDHIKYISTKLSKCTGILSKARCYLRKESLQNLYYTFAYPYFSYCNIVWGNACHSYLNQILKLQKRLIRLINFSAYLAHTAPLFKKCNILNVYQIHDYSTAIFMFKFTKCELPHTFSNMFLTNSSIHQYSTRRSTDYHIPKCHSSVLQKATRYYGAILWNSIPSNIKQCNTLPSLKNHTSKNSCIPLTIDCPGDVSFYYMLPLIILSY